MSDFDLTPLQTDLFLDRVLQGNSEAQFYAAAKLFCVEVLRFDEHEAKCKAVSENRAMEKLRRICVRRGNGYAPGIRISRQGCPTNWMDFQVVWFAFFREDNERNNPTVEYVAGILQRTVDEVEALKQQRKKQVNLKSVKEQFEGFFPKEQVV